NGSGSIPRGWPRRAGEASGAWLTGVAVALRQSTRPRSTPSPYPSRSAAADDPVLPMRPRGHEPPAGRFVSGLVQFDLGWGMGGRTHARLLGRGGRDRAALGALGAGGAAAAVVAALCAAARRRAPPPLEIGNEQPGDHHREAHERQPKRERHASP